MANPFTRRATELLREDEAFLAVVTAEPLRTFFAEAANDEKLYDRLVVVTGTPGSGKTTLSRLFQYSIIVKLLDHSNLDAYRPIIGALQECGAIRDDQPALAACRIPLEREYRDLWELPYGDSVKSGLMCSLLQARTVIAWLRNLERVGIELKQVDIVPSQGTDAALSAIGGTDAIGLLDRARKVEETVYNVSAALIPPPLGDVDPERCTTFQPFNVIESLKIGNSTSQSFIRPLAIFDDAHLLHIAQFKSLWEWLVNRELKVARWVLTRLDGLTPKDVLQHSAVHDSETGFNRDREITEIWLQNSPGQSRRRYRVNFRKVAKDMANRYLTQMQSFTGRGLTSLEPLLSTTEQSLSPAKLARFQMSVEGQLDKLGITTTRRQDFERQIAEYKSESLSHDVSVGMLSVLMHRYVNRTGERDLFEDQPENTLPTPSLECNASVEKGAKIHLFHHYDRPYYFGLNAVCDGSSENAEQFLRLVSCLVSRIETQLIRGKSPSLDCVAQHNLLRERAKEIVDGWSFPEYQNVRSLSDFIASECITKSLERNASLGSGANAMGILQAEFETIPTKYPRLARILKYGIAHNAFSIVSNHKTKGRLWCLIELSGVVSILHGLTLDRGGFLERNIATLNRFLDQSRNG